MPTLRLYLLGTLEMRCDEQPLPKPPTLKSQALLVYLILHRDHPQTREQLAGLFWGDRSERKARQSLATALWHIRRCLPNAGLILSDVHSVQFDPQADLWLDMDEFESQASRDDLQCLQSAAALYRGDFMDGFYDDWIINERYRLEILYANVLARLMAGQETKGEHRAALSTALLLLEQDPLREDAHRLAMRAYCRLGQRNLALEQYRRCRDVVGNELGAEPMVETSELYQAILEGRFVVERRPQPAPTEELAVEPTIPLGRSPLDVMAPSRLVGREQALLALRECWQGAAAGQGGLALVSGEAGVGKTRLVEEFANHQRWQGACVLWGRCYEFERILPYQPVAEALRTILPALAPTVLADFPTWILGQVSRLVPEMQEKRPGLQVTPSIRSDQERARFFDGLSRFLVRLSSQWPLLIVLDDLHWATESTLQLIHYLARHLAGHPVLMVGTFRPEAVGQQHALQALQHQLSREGLVRFLHLSRLSPASVEAMVIEMSGAGEAVLPLARRLYQDTEGNPFFVMEVVKALFETGELRLEGGVWRGAFDRSSEGALPLPKGVSEAIQARARGLDREAQEVLNLAAVLGREFDFEVLNEVWDRGEEATLEAVDTLLRRRLIEEGSGPLGRDYAFTHHLIQEVLYTGMPRRRCQYLHLQVGAGLEALAGDATEAIAGELAFHYRRGQQWEKTMIWAERAGDCATTQHASQEAIGYYSLALEALQQEGPCTPEQQIRLLVKRAQAHIADADFEKAQIDLEGAVAKAKAAELVELQIEPLLVLAESHFLRMSSGPLLAAAGEARMLAQHLEDERAIGLALQWESRGLYLAHRFQEAVERAEQAIDLLSYADDVEGQGWAQAAAAAAYQDGLGDYRRARAHLEAGYALFVASGSTLGEINAHHCLGNLCLYTGDLEEAIEHFETALQTATQLGYRAQEPVELAHLTLTYALLGAWDAAQQYGERCLQTSRAFGLGLWEYYALFWLGFIEQESGNLDAARDLYGQLSPPAGPFALNQLSLLHRELGEEAHWRTALELAQEAYVKAQSHGKPRDQIRALSNQAMAHLRLGQPQEAVSCSEQAILQADESSAEWFVQEVLYNHARVLHAAGRKGEAARFLEKAYREVMATADRIRDPQLRTCFLENVRLNRTIVAEFEAETPV